jgi:hypothetical protein
MLCRQAEADAAKAAAAEAKKVRDAEKQAMKKERQRLRKLADGGEGQQRLLSIGAGKDVACFCMLSFVCSVLYAQFSCAAQRRKAHWQRCMCQAAARLERRHVADDGQGQQRLLSIGSGVLRTLMLSVHSA